MSHQPLNRLKRMSECLIVLHICELHSRFGIWQTSDRISNRGFWSRNHRIIQRGGDNNQLAFPGWEQSAISPGTEILVPARLALLD